MRSNTFSTWALSVMGLAVFWLLAGSLTAETVRLYPFVLLFFYQLYYFSVRLVCAAWRYGSRRMGTAARQGAAWPVCVVRACRPGAVCFCAVRPARKSLPHWPCSLFLGLAPRPSAAGFCGLLPSTFLTEFLFVLLRRIFPGRWFLLFACGLVSLGASMVYGLPGQVAYGADGALRYLVYYALGAVVAALVQKQKQGKYLSPTQPALVRTGGGLPFTGAGGILLLVRYRVGHKPPGRAVSACAGMPPLCLHWRALPGMALAAFVLARLRLCAAVGRAAGSRAWPWRRAGAVCGYSRQGFGRATQCWKTSL